VQEPEPSVPSVQLEPEPSVSSVQLEPELSPLKLEPEPAAQEPEPVRKKPRAPRTKGTESSRLGATTTDDAPVDADADADGVTRRGEAPRTDAPADGGEAPPTNAPNEKKAPRPRAKKVLPEPVFEKPAPEIYDRISNLIVNSKFKLPARLPANYSSLSSVDSYLFAKTKNESEQTAAEKKIIRDVIKLIEKDDKAIAKAQKDAAKALKAANKKPTTNKKPTNKKPTLSQIILQKDAIIAHLQSILITNNITFDITNINITNNNNTNTTNATTTNATTTNATNVTNNEPDNNDADADADEQPESNPWTEHFSQKHQKPYWYNNITKLSSWVKPIDA
jgi:hypothetical protein